MLPADVEIETGPYGLSKLAVNGEDWTQSVRGVHLIAGRDEIPVIEVELVSKPVNIDGPGIVVTKMTADDAKAIVLDFLNSVDPYRIEAKMLENDRFDQSPAEGFLEAMKGLFDA